MPPIGHAPALQSRRVWASRLRRTALFASLTEPASGLRLSVTILSRDETVRIDRPPHHKGCPRSPSRLDAR